MDASIGGLWSTILSRYNKYVSSGGVGVHRSIDGRTKEIIQFSEFVCLWLQGFDFRSDVVSRYVRTYSSWREMAGSMNDKSIRDED
jgi:hypothetical protein